MSDDKFEGWAILEIMGHRKLCGYIKEQEIAGNVFLRIDVPGNDGKVTTQFYSSGAIYSITPTTKETVEKIKSINNPAPVHPWQFPELLTENNEELQQECPF